MFVVLTQESTRCVILYPVHKNFHVCLNYLVFHVNYEKAAKKVE